MLPGRFVVELDIFSPPFSLLENIQKHSYLTVTFFLEITVMDCSLSLLISPNSTGSNLMTGGECPRVSYFIILSQLGINHLEYLFVN